MVQLVEKKRRATLERQIDKKLIKAERTLAANRKEDRKIAAEKAEKLNERVKAW